MNKDEVFKVEHSAPVQIGRHKTAGANLGRLARKRRTWHIPICYSFMLGIGPKPTDPTNLSLVGPSSIY